MTTKKILSTDYSHLSDAALDHATTLAKQMDAVLA